MSLSKTSLSIIIALATFSCSTSPSHIPLETEASSASVDWFIHKYSLIDSPPVQKFISRVGSRLAESAKVVSSQARVTRTCQSDLMWQIFVLDTNSHNAFSVGSHIILLTRGLIQHTSSEAELASVIAHEISHDLLCHTRDLLQDSNASSQSPTYSFSLEKELKADTLSVQILKVANYDIRHAIAPLYISYRQNDRLVATKNSDWLKKRTANMHRQINSTKNHQPATASTREFMKVKYYLSER